MNENSTLLFILESSEGDDQLISVNDMLDPYGNCSKELGKHFDNLVFTPREELISNILRNA